MLQEEIVDAIRETIEQVLNGLSVKPYRIVLFGSRSRGDHREDSDWDIFVVLDDNEVDYRERKKIWWHIYDGLHRRFPAFSFDIIVKSRKAYENEKDVINTLSNEVYQNGVVLL